MIRPHGGRLIDRIASGQRREELLEEASELPSLQPNAREISDLEMIATGALSPLQGFMVSDDYESVCESARLSTGLPWTLPVTLSVPRERTEGLRNGQRVALRGPDGTLHGLLEVDEIFEPDKEREAATVLQTTDVRHPGVVYLRESGDVYLGGPVTLLERPPHEEFERFRLDPKETRVLFKAKGWDTVAAFQTRNPIHRAHEYLQKCALEMVDALLIHPLMGETKADDIPAEVRLRCYLAMLESYFPTERVTMSILPAAMRYAGPREAVFHAIVRKNYGCTHFIVGRDHAGVGDYYGTYDAHTIFREFDRLEIGITPLFFDHAYYCQVCGSMASKKTCPHDASQHVFLSGTKIREMLQNGESLPPEFTRPEVAEILARHYGPDSHEDAEATAEVGVGAVGTGSPAAGDDT